MPGGLPTFSMFFFQAFFYDAWLEPSLTLLVFYPLSIGIRVTTLQLKSAKIKIGLDLPSPFHL